MITVKISEEEYRTTVTNAELKEAFKTPRNYYNFMKTLHRQIGIPFLEDMELYEWVLEKEREEKEGKQ